MRAIIQFLQQRGFGVIDDGFYSRIDNWFRWYRGKVPSFHTYRQYNGQQKITRERKTLGMAKKIPEDWANLELNEKVSIVISDTELDVEIHRVLDANNFRVRGNQLVELSFALGTGAFVEYVDGARVKVDYVRAGMIYPLSWDNGEVTECAFGSERVVGKDRRVYLNIHTLENGKYVIENIMFRRDGNTLTEIDLPDGVQSKVITESDVPRFQIIKPNIVNNVDPDCPMGISVYANAIDQMEGLDLVYDSYVNEFRLGKKRIIVPVTMARIVMEETGATTPIFDSNDTEFYTVNMGNDAPQKIEEINMELRHEAHEAALKTALNVLSAKCGLGNDRYNFDRDAVKTATEVVSEKSDLFQNLKKHEQLLEKALIDLCRAIASLLGRQDDFEISIKFDDSIIEDKAAEQLRDQQQVRDRLMTVWEYRVKYFAESEGDAKKMAAELSSGQMSDDSLMGFGGDG